MPRRVSDYGPFFACDAPECDYRVGAHRSGPHVGEPLGTPANEAMREARKAAHVALDRLWRLGTDGNKRRRTRVYAWLSSVLGCPPDRCHIGMFDAWDCLRVVEASTAMIAHPGLGAALAGPAFAPAPETPEGIAEHEKGIPTEWPEPRLASSREVIEGAAAELGRLAAIIHEGADYTLGVWPTTGSGSRTYRKGFVAEYGEWSGPIAATESRAAAALVEVMREAAHEKVRELREEAAAATRTADRAMAALAEALSGAARGAE